LSVERRKERIDLYTDQRSIEKKDGDELTQEEIQMDVEKKYGASNRVRGWTLICVGVRCALRPDDHAKQAKQNQHKNKSNNQVLDNQQ